MKRQSILINIHPAIVEQIDEFAKELGLSRNRLLENLLLKEITNSKGCSLRLKKAFIARAELLKEGL